MPASPPVKPASLSILFPASDDIDTIARMIVRAAKTAAELTPDFEIIVVDDGSTDGAVDIADEPARTYSQVHPSNRVYPSPRQ